MVSVKAIKIMPQKNVLHIMVAVSVMVACLLGIHRALHSSLFSLDAVAVEPLSKNYPLSADQVLKIARVEIQSGNNSGINLVGLDLKPIEARLIRHPWIKGVVLEKRFPGSLLIRVIERNPAVMVEGKGGKMVYLESDGALFEDSSLSFSKELPIVSGISFQDEALLHRTVEFITKWFDPEKAPGLKLSALNYDEKLGLRAVVSYPLKNKSQMRTLLEMGINMDEVEQVEQGRLMMVLHYLSEKSMPASKIWLGDGKKIVVKVARGS